VPPAVEAEPPAPSLPALEVVTSLDAVTDPEMADRVSRYNFEELGRILTDRVSGEARPEPAPRPAARASMPDGVISLNAETLVLNRLPLAILVFRDQQVLFANRALTDLLGHESVEGLRAAGIASIFPAEGTTAAGRCESADPARWHAAWRRRPAAVGELARARRADAVGNAGGADARA